MKKWYFFSFVALITTIVLEILPYGAVLNFGRPDGTLIRRTFSYFDMTSFGYANFGPVPTALFSIVILIGVAVLIVVKKPLSKTNSAMLICSIIALFFSVLPVIQDKAYISEIGIIISILLFSSTGFLILARIKILGNK